MPPISPENWDELALFGRKLADAAGEAILPHFRIPAAVDNKSQSGFDPVTTPSDQFFLLGAFGISNFLTGFLYLLISRKARELSPYVLAIIPATYLLGMIGIGVAGVQAQADFPGKYFMMVYFAVCVVTVAVFLVQRGAQRKNL